MAIDLQFDAERIKALRKALEMSQYTFAEAVGVNQPAVSSWESGRRRPERRQTLEKLHQLELEAGLSPTEVGA